MDEETNKDAVETLVDVIKTIAWWCSIILPAISIVRGTVKGVVGELSDIKKERSKKHEIPKG